MLIQRTSESELERRRLQVSCILAAGTATAGTAPLKLTSGTLLSVLELGAIEFVDNGTIGHLYITQNVAGVLTRVQIV